MPRSGPGEERPFEGVEVSRRGAIAGAPFALAAACALTACGATPGAGPVTTAARAADGELRGLRDGAADPVVAGERLNGELLRRFYARRGFAPVWGSRPGQAESLVRAVLDAGAHGLDPGLFHAPALRRRSDLPPLDRELLLSGAFLSYADALAHGAIPVARRRAGEELAPEPVDVAAVLEEAVGRPEPAAAIEALAPATPAYAALREALPRLRRGAAPGDEDRLRTIEVNLERQRWLPRRLPADRVWVNVADQRVVLLRADRPVFSARVVVGADAEDQQSPEFRRTIEGIFFNPPWIVPRDIVVAELLPRIQRDPGYLARNDMVLLENGEVEQRAGPNAGLGAIMLDMPNRFDVYLHDTPGKHVFARENRRLSHGCIRVENCRDFAALLMRQPPEAVDEVIATGVTTRRGLPGPLPVFVVYQTAFVDAEGVLQVRPDFYRRDLRVWERLQGRAPADEAGAEPDGPGGGSAPSREQPSGGGRTPASAGPVAARRSGPRPPARIAAPDRPKPAVPVRAWRAGRR